MNQNLLQYNQDIKGLANQQLLILWKTEQDFRMRDRIIIEMKKRKLFPEESDVTKSLADGGLYPDVEDPNFVSRLLKKSEFADTYSFPPTTETSPDFEVTPVQRFVANFLHPRTPYMSALLYHGVGVGKTCAAIQTAEAYLDVYPRRKVMIVAPPTIQSGFIRTIFDMETLKIGKGEELNNAIGCTGNTYLRLTGLVRERNKEVIERDIKKAIKRRYEFYGYLQFRNHIRNILNKASKLGTEEEIRYRQLKYIKAEFNNRLLIIDEAHNLRDVSSTAVVDEDIDTPGVESEKEEERSGKLLTPFLNYLLDSTDGMKLLLMTATPMFNSVLEIVLLCNFLLRNDKKQTITQDQIMNADGTLKEGADAFLKPIANAYISFMRGENPNSFPIRLLPQENRINRENYPEKKFGSKKNESVSEEDKERLENLPLIKSDCPEESLSHIVMAALTEKKSPQGSSYMIIDGLLQAGNCVFPSGDEEDPESFVGLKGFQNTFTRKGSLITADEASWLSEDEIGGYSPKAATILESLKKCEGVGFVYSRFVTTGALLLALVLEANGYTPYGRSPLLKNGIQSEGGQQCALCPLRMRNHSAATHGDFVPAKYVILTGDKELSPRNKDAIEAARSDANVDGSVVKVVLGSQIAGEGLDLRFIREVHILDAWFHLNKTEQIIGRGIRFRSHSLIEDPKKRNTTIFLHVLTIPGFGMETADLSSYRTALQKAILVGQVSRRLKIFAVDCNLRKEVSVLSGLDKRVQIDSHGQSRAGNDRKGIVVDDMPNTAICDWMDDCKYTCDPIVQINLDTADDSTYDTFSARYRESKLQKVIKAMFAKQPFYTAQDILDVLIQTGAPRSAIDMTIQGILNNRMFRVKSGSREGYITYKNRLFLFQPDIYKDELIPLALRVADFQIKRDEFTPKTIVRTDTPIINVEDETAPIKDVFWQKLIQWVSAVIEGRQKTVGIEIERQIELYIPDFKQLRDATIHKLSMIIYIVQRVPDKENMKKAIMEYLWDEWLDMKTQYTYCQNPDEIIKEVAVENIRNSGGIKAYRFINSNTNALEYLCDNYKPCPSGIVEEFEGLKDDIMERSAARSKTGSIYGFIVPKMGTMVFKTNNPHPDGEKVKGGKECAIVSAREYQPTLVSIGTELTKAGLPNLDLDLGHLSASKDITNNVRGCTVIDLVLRYMDIKRVGGKRWFFRPLAAYYSGHIGKITKEARQALESAKKEFKKVEAQQKKLIKEGKKALTKVTDKEKAKAKPKIKLVRKDTAAPVAATTTAKKPIVLRRRTEVKAPEVKAPEVKAPEVEGDEVEGDEVERDE
jgi:hypothetical protein